MKLYNKSCIVRDGFELHFYVFQYNLNSKKEDITKLRYVVESQEDALQQARHDLDKEISRFDDFLINCQNQLQETTKM